MDAKDRLRAMWVLLGVENRVENQSTERYRASASFPYHRTCYDQFRACFCRSAQHPQ